MPPDKWPVEAVDYIKKHPEQFGGNMFNQYVWGGYLLQALPEHRTFVDGRTDFYGEALIRQFDDTSALRTKAPKFCGSVMQSSSKSSGASDAACAAASISAMSA